MWLAHPVSSKEGAVNFFSFLFPPFSSFVQLVAVYDTPSEFPGPQVL